MELITQRQVIKNVPAKWKYQYCDSNYNEWEILSVPGTKRTRQSSKTIYEKLLALDLDKCTADDINKIVGNESWTRLTCDNCGQDVKVIVEVADGPYNHAGTVSICLACIQKAYTLFAESSDT